MAQQAMFSPCRLGRQVGWTSQEQRVVTFQSLGAAGSLPDSGFEHSQRVIASPTSH